MTLRQLALLQNERPVPILKARRSAWLSFGLKTAINPEQPRVAAANNLDWVDEQDMTPQQQADIQPYCCGAYIEPSRDYPDAKQTPEQASLRVNALQKLNQTLLPSWTVMFIFLRLPPSSQ